MWSHVFAAGSVTMFDAVTNALINSLPRTHLLVCEAEPSSQRHSLGCGDVALRQVARLQLAQLLTRERRARFLASRRRLDVARR